jgi:hypothetical protein
MGDIAEQTALRLKKLFLPGHEFFDPGRHIVKIAAQLGYFIAPSEQRIFAYASLQVTRGEALGYRAKPTHGRSEMPGQAVAHESRREQNGENT